MDNVELLMSFGLTRQEARVYIILLGEGALSGYFPFECICGTGGFSR